MLLYGIVSMVIDLYILMSEYYNYYVERSIFFYVIDLDLRNIHGTFKGIVITTYLYLNFSPLI